jgi:hypothetical protein
VTSVRNDSSRLWDEIQVAFEAHRTSGDHDAIAALNRISVKCLGLAAPIPLDPKTATVSDEVLSPSALRELVLYHKRVKPLRSHEPIVVVVWRGKRFVVDGNTRVNMWLGSGETLSRRAIVLHPVSSGAA